MIKTLTEILSMLKRELIQCFHGELSKFLIVFYVVYMEHALILAVQSTVFLFLVGNCSKRRKEDHTKSAASDVLSEDVVEKKDEFLTAARPRVRKQRSRPSSTELQGKVTKKKLRDLSDEPSLSRSKLQGSSELESEESLKGRPKPLQPPSPQAQEQQAHDKSFNVEQTQLASIPVTPRSQDIEPTQYPEPSPIGTRTEGTPPASSTEKNESTNSSGPTASKDSPVPLHGEKTESPAPVHEEKIVSPVPAHEEKMESPVPALEEKMESPIPALEEKMESPVPAHEEKMGSPVPAHEEKIESSAPAHEEKMDSPVQAHEEKMESPVSEHAEKRGSAEKTESAPSSIGK
ncbi:hypothetical protein ANCCAN_11769 [Ancylostoma caninum]|uniref:Uncharacterized protein n=1 Tax=Ancylostoma caninum TaxID=29170 RepID=A0A368GCX5_ANCCA|nr:hypothetical protein ANCCAN_11769 [Ancylostoma caninum]